MCYSRYSLTVLHTGHGMKPHRSLSSNIFHPSHFINPKQISRSAVPPSFDYTRPMMSSLLPDVQSVFTDGVYSPRPWSRWVIIIITISCLLYMHLQIPTNNHSQNRYIRQKSNAKHKKQHLTGLWVCRSPQAVQGYSSTLLLLCLLVSQQKFGSFSKLDMALTRFLHNILNP